MDEIIRVNNLHKVYDTGELSFEALRGLNFSIKEGEFVVILGPSGSGKSTLLNIIGGMDRASEGDIFIKERELSNSTEKHLTLYRRDTIGFVFQFYNLLSNLTVKENVELATEICKDSLDIDDILESVGLSDKKKSFPSQLSGGEQQRVAIARAVAKNPMLLLCDEPTGALDYKTGVSILELLTKINKKFNKTVLVITHNASISRIANRVIKMKSGEIEEVIVNENPRLVSEIEW